jgi:flagellar biosynthesis anti-sigma factor FlgM
MNLRIHGHGGQHVDSSSNLKNGTAQQASVSPQPANSTVDAMNAAQDTATLSSASSQLSGGLAVRQDKVDALRAQMVSGNYTIDTHAVASAMSRDPFWSPSLFNREQ